jgi:polysaccharide pyruvyl transferase WcaK-like protein
MLRWRRAQIGGLLPDRGKAGDGSRWGRPERALRIGIFGAPLDTGNLGVSALGLSTIEGLARFATRGLECLLFDHGRGKRPLECGVAAQVTRIGCFYSRRFYRRENLRTALAVARSGFVGIHPLLRDLRGLDALLDVSGGDSFTDLYGDWRFRAVTAPKALALAMKLPLVLLPQTYGPFSTAETRGRARELLLGARRVWARDAHSLAVVRDLLGPAFDAERHRDGVDVAFGLPARAPAEDAADFVQKFRRDAGLVLGLNVSGLLFHRESQAQGQYGLAAPYRTLVEALLRKLLEYPSARVLLIPHVVPPCGAEEDDVAACEALRASLPSDLAERVTVAPTLSDPREAKWVISHCDWFCGTRMHACIAALSQCVPTLGIAYSGKTAGVFETVSMGDQVADARQLSAGAVIERVERSLADRAALAGALADAMPRVLARWESQFRTLISELAT